MSAGSSSTSHFDDATRRIERELKRLITTLSDEVVPVLRQDGGKALHRIADKLHQLGDALDRSRS
ncbi:MAG: hypothetical protein ACRD0Y_07530 [Terriglobales bacterium]